jgi:hypothetical protein
MKRFRNIRFYIGWKPDGRPALEQAAELARLHHGKLTAEGAERHT